MPEDRKLPPLSTRIETERLVLRPPHGTDVPELRRLLRANADHLRPWSPMPRPGEDPSSLTEISKSILRQRREWSKGESYVLFVASREAPGYEGGQAGALVGRVAFTGVMRRAFQSTYLGYWIDGRCQRRGLMTEAVRGAIGFAFHGLGLHRVQAAVMPRNVGSKRVLGKIGFRKEGESERYLQIAGRWEDHEIFAMTQEEWE
jgi:ribosomal-protein-alanine N-acetyltransferase